MRQQRSALPRMEDLPMKPVAPTPAPQPAPKHLKKAPKRAKRPASQAQRSRTARANAKEAPRDEQGRFARKHLFEHVFDGIERFVGGVKKTHKAIKRTTRKIRRAFKQQPRMVVARPARRRRVVRRRVR